MPRRGFLGQVALAGVGRAAVADAGARLGAATESPTTVGKALVAISMDLEMARNFPRWEDTHWDYEKGNLNAETKRYALEAARRVRAAGGAIHFFVVGQVLEQEDVDWLRQLVIEGHPVGNHSYDHVNVLATRPEDLQFRFQRAPWLIEGRTPAQVIRDNVLLCSEALRTRLGIRPNGFRTPGGFADGLSGRADVQRLLIECGFDWISCRYPAHPYGRPGQRASLEVLEGIVKAQSSAQPFSYPTGLVDVPMSPISDVGAFRNARWPLADFLQAVRLGIEWAIEHRAVYDLLTHPSVLYPNDPEFKVCELVCDLVNRSGGRAVLAGLPDLAARALRKAP